ncbi:uncharacterized protein CELE_K03B8.4 [Caenorhabditis elegans]|uniref:Uncharacterized protein n=1 Tax=Caenorhabditis elegans TaxID=6239 RepID=Q21177_CAEEL|nr:Uncharacterized protein CELE_K03B8.4 [Caenorhabditis elegans]CAA98500.1 Uncharacterized protein CELE_K03B8.4 [Caenorhabditis elegans]|eukprot:NP_505890.1 Uncharacterized protein CELE_K03B8.4 [Caenorhabditis elegans]
MSQNSDLKTMNELSGDLEAERFAESYVRPETEEGVQRYMFQKVNQKRHELEQILVFDQIKAPLPKKKKYVDSKQVKKKRIIAKENQLVKQCKILNE